MARYKDFGSPVAANSDEPITFQLYGETYKCQPAMQGRLLIEFIAQSSVEDPSSSAKAILNFFDSALAPDDRGRFKELTESEDRVVPMETLTEIMDWLVEQYTGRPTEPSSPSEPGDTSTGTTFAGVPSSPPVPVSVS